MDRRDDAALAGWAFKQGSKVKNWKKRFFVLRGRALAYYAAPPSLSKAEDDKEKGRVVVVGAELDAANAMLLVTCERKTQLLKLKPLVPEDAPLWLAALERAAGKSVPSSAVRHAGPAVIMSRQASGDGDYNLFGTNLHDEWDGDYRGLHDATASESVADYYKAAQPMPTQAPPPPPPVDETSARLKMVASTLAMDIDNQTFHDDRSDNDTSFDFGESDDDSMLSRRSIDNRAALARGNHIGVAREGWLAINDGGWKTRYAVLAGPMLTYFASKGAADTDALASVWVTSVSLSSLRANALDLLLDSGRVLGISADSREELIRWERAFASVLGTSVLLQSASSKDETLDEFERDVGVPTGAARRPSSYTGVFREGWLLVKQGFGKHEWQRRYFVLNGATLQERETPTATPLSEGFVVNLIVRNDSSMAEFELELMSGRSLRLQAANTVDAEAWIQALSDLVGTPAVKSMDPQQPTAHLATPVIRPPVNISSPRPQKVSKKGWLMKEGGLIKSWKRRYFILDGDALHYFDKDRNGGLLGGGIVFRVVHSSAAANSLDIHFVNGRLLRVSTETRAEIDAWYDALRAAADFSVHRVQRSSEAALESSGLDDCQRGWLFKRGQRMKTWKKRYFFIQRNRLMYYNTIGGELLGSGTVFDVTDGNQRPLSLDVRFQNGRLLHIAAADDEDYKQWREALKSASNISESVLSQQNSFSQEETPFGKDFDFDMQDGNEAEGDDGDDLFDDYADDGELSAGYGTWEAAMNGLSRENSWDSDLSDDDSMSDSGRVSTPREMQRRESDTASVPEEPRGCSGWLRKEGKRVKNWKRRYFTLQGTTIKYFKSASGSLLRALEVTQVEEYPAVKFGFVIVTTEGRRLVVAAESNDEYEKWLLALWGVIADQRASLAGGNGGPGEDTRYSAVGAINVRGVPTSPVGSGAAATPFAKSDVSHSGWLEKEGQVFKTWKRRYFTVKNGALMYFSDIGGETQGHGTVHGVIIDKTKPNTLRILLAKDRVLRVTAATPAEMNTWFEVLLATQKPAPASRSPRGSTYGSEAGDEYSEMASSVGSAAGHRSVGGSAPSSPVAARTPPTRSRFDESDYLKNDTITNESFLRIRGPGDELSQTTGSFYKPRPFKGDLAFETKLPTPSETTAETDESTQLTRIDSEEDLEYLRGSSVDHARAEAMRKQREKEQELLPQKCTACCIVM